jgi:shikimate dehydrogenase
MSRLFGLIGFPLTHSFSKGYFAEKFQNLQIKEVHYENFPIASINEFQSLWESHPNLEGINITIPYKKEVIPFLFHQSKVVSEIGACNCIRNIDGALFGYNTDVIGFEKSLLPYLKPHHNKALILGTGGAAAAVAYVLQSLHIPFQFVSRKATPTTLGYDDLSRDIIESHTLIINTSPVGMYPNVNDAPAIAYDAITASHHLYDLIYNPIMTSFLQQGAAQGASTQNGLEMLHLQAEASWEIWNYDGRFPQ